MKETGRNRSPTFQDVGDIEPLTAGPGNIAEHQQFPRSMKQALKSSVRKGPAKPAKTPPKLKLSKEIGFTVPTPPKPSPDSDDDLRLGQSRQGRERRAPKKFEDFQVRLSSKPPTPVTSTPTDLGEPKRKRAREEPAAESTEGTLPGSTAGFEPVGDLLQPSTRVRIT